MAVFSLKDLGDPVKTVPFSLEPIFLELEGVYYMGPILLI